MSVRSISDRLSLRYRKIERSYQSQFRSQGSLISQQFYAERAALFAELKVMVNKPVLSRLVQKAVKFKPYEDMRHALNLSVSLLFTNGLQRGWCN